MESPLNNLLSICIPTFNRHEFLKWTLEKTIKDFPGVKIIVSDDCSRDDTRHVARMPEVRYIQQGTNIGPFPNMRAALLAANTKYCMFLGDDDYMVPEEVAKGIQFMEDHADVLTYFAPCQLWDQVGGKAHWDAFYVAEDETFSRPDLLWNFILLKHVWPEHAIYRRKNLEEILHPRQRPYWCFTDLGNVATRGKVHFAKTPYYRNIVQHPVGMRSKLGDRQALTDFEEYRMGLEVLAYELFKNHLTLELKQRINDGIRQFIYVRYEVANRILVAQQRNVEAAILQRRMILTGY